MRAIRPMQTGGPEVLKLSDFPTPAPGTGAALVRIEAAGVNFIDIYQRTGQYKMEPPILLGLEGAGVVEAVGEGVRDLRMGDRVAWSSIPGSYATHVAAPVDKLVQVPEGVDLNVAAALLLQGITAHYLTTDTFRLAAGHTCLVHAAAGGVGLLLCQLAKRSGARVIGTVSTDEKAKLARAAGADEIILYAKSDFEAEARRLTGGKGVDVVYDSVGKDTFDKSLRCLRPRGMLVLFGQSSGAVPPVDLQILAARGSLFLTRPTIGSYTATRQELLERARDLFAAVQEGKLKVTIGTTLPLSRAADAHRMLEGRKTVGKALLLPTK